MTTWTDLADDELFARLTQRGVTLGRAELLVTYRDEPSHADTITEILE